MNPSPVITQLTGKLPRLGTSIKPAWIRPTPDREREFQDEMATARAQERAAGFGQPPGQEPAAKGPAPRPVADTGVHGDEGIPDAGTDRAAAEASEVVVVPPVRAPEQQPDRRTDNPAGDGAQGTFRPRQGASAPPAPAASPDPAALAAGTAGGQANAAAGMVRTQAEGAPVTATGATAAAARRQEPPAAARSEQGAATTRSPQLQELAQEHQDAIFRRVALALTETGGEMDVVLEPPELGRVQLHFELSGDQARLVVGADRPEVADQIHGNLAGLRAALAVHGIQVDQFDVKDGRSFDAEREGGESLLRPGRRRTRNLEPVPAPQARRILRRIAGDGALDILV